ncbi:Hypothetical predicted protein [Mytilus galloprovincialis]|uniref:Uncharacterized protein n=1 Tax=Mytilus galloprovincialis TaxID=29158 RepID=A0A8B6F7G0_MYTGA|nr:Hypothetical predicted protein [Mytilus galloprovincialis]
MCIVKKHKKHITSDINESVKQLQVEVKQKIDLKIKNLKQHQEHIEHVKGKFKTDIKEAVRVITEVGNQIKQWIDKKVQALVTLLEEKETANLKALQPIITGFQNDFEQFRYCQTAFTESPKFADVTKLLTKLKHIKSEVDGTCENQSPVMPTIKYIKRNVSEREIINLFGDVSFKEQSSKTMTYTNAQNVGTVVDNRM